VSDILLNLCYFYVRIFKEVIIMKKWNFVKIIMMMTMILFLVIIGGCSFEEEEEVVVPPPPPSPVLSSLQLSSGSLSPEFSPAITQYTASVANFVTSIDITPETISANALISVNGTNVLSGSPSGAITLNVGPNTISIIVGNAGGSATYKVTVMREEPPVYRKITPEEARNMMLELSDYIILDVRTEAEFIEKRIEGAILIPHNEIESRAEAKLPDKGQLILVYCQAGIRSKAATESLMNLGYSNVYDFGGILDWPYETIGEGENYSYWTDVADTSWWDVASTDSTFKISTPQQFAGIITLLNERKTNFSGATITLENNINLAGREWKTIADSFQGVLDGGGHDISNMKISSNYGDVGLFGTLEPTATIKNIKLTNVDINIHPG